MTTGKRTKSKTVKSKTVKSKTVEPDTANARSVAARAAVRSAETPTRPEPAANTPLEAVERLTAALTHAPVARTAMPAPSAFADVMTLNTAAVAVALEAGNAMLKGMGDINRELFAYARSTMDSGVEGTKVLMGARTVDEVVAVQRDMVRRSVEDLVAESTKIGQLAVKTANATGAPISAHMTEAFKTLSRPAAM